MPLLGVNIDHIATVRQARGTIYPDPLQAAWEAELGGADGITVHLREDRRHIQLSDVQLLKEKIHTRLNLEMAPTAEMVKIAQHIKPAFCCLVPEKREELTTEGGLDVANHVSEIKSICQSLQEVGCQVSLFINADPKQIDAAVMCGAAFIEIHTGEYAHAITPATQQAELTKIQQGVRYARQAGLTVNVGHGLHYHNVQAIVAVPGVYELNIGHAIVARALFVGLRKAVREMKRLVG